MHWLGCSPPKKERTSASGAMFLGTLWDLIVRTCCHEAAFQPTNIMIETCHPGTTGLAINKDCSRCPGLVPSYMEQNQKNAQSGGVRISIQVGVQNFDDTYTYAYMFTYTYIYINISIYIYLYSCRCICNCIYILYKTQINLDMSQ